MWLLWNFRRDPVLASLLDSSREACSENVTVSETTGTHKILSFNSGTTEGPVLVGALDLRGETSDIVLDVGQGNVLHSRVMPPDLKHVSNGNVFVSDTDAQQTCTAHAQSGIRHDLAGCENRFIVEPATQDSRVELYTGHFSPGNHSFISGISDDSSANTVTSDDSSGSSMSPECQGHRENHRQKKRGYHSPLDPELATFDGEFRDLNSFHSRLKQIAEIYRWSERAKLQTLAACLWDETID